MRPALRITDRQVTAAILAGGRGTRLGGVDKGLLSVDGREMVRWVMDGLPDDVPVLMVANRNLDAYRALGLTVISDPWPDFRGPLAGMLSALRAAHTPWVQILPCDGIALPRNLTPRLLARAIEERAPAAYATALGQGQFLCALLHRHLTPHLEAVLEDGERAVCHWLSAIGAVPVDFSDADPAPIWSVNDPDELRAIDLMPAMRT